MVSYKKKKIILITIAVICSFGICYSLYYFHIKNNIVFHTYYGEVAVLWGTDLNEKKDELYHINKGNSDNYICNLIYDDNKINQVQDLIVEVSHHGITAKKTFKLVIVDEDKPIIKYNDESKVVNKDFDIEEYLEVYDQRLFDDEIFYLKSQDDITPKYYNEDGYYYYTEGIYSNTYQLEEGLNKIHVIAWDDHGNESEKIIELQVE